MINGTTVTTTGRDSASARICVVDGWRALDDHRDHVCRVCETRMGHHVTLLETAATWLAVVARHEPTPAGDLNLAAASLTGTARLRLPAGPQDDQLGLSPIGSVLARWLHEWTGEITEAMPVRFIARQLRAYLSWACSASDVDIVRFDGELRDLVAASRRALNRNLQATRYAAPCPKCGERRLGRAVGSEWIRCAACACLWSEEEYAAAALQAAPDSAEMYAHEVAVFLGVPANTVNQWCWRGRLAPDTWDDHGRPMYTAGQARRVAHEVRLYRENLAEVAVISDAPGNPVFIDTYPAGTVLTLGSGYRVYLRRGMQVTTGKLGHTSRIDPPAERKAA